MPPITTSVMIVAGPMRLRPPVEAVAMGRVRPTTRPVGDEDRPTTRLVGAVEVPRRRLAKDGFHPASLACGLFTVFGRDLIVGARHRPQEMAGEVATS